MLNNIPHGKVLSTGRLIVHPAKHKADVAHTGRLVVHPPKHQGGVAYSTPKGN